MVRMEHPWGREHPTTMTVRDFLDNTRGLAATLRTAINVEGALMSKPVGHTLKLGNMLPSRASKTGKVVLVGLLDPATEGGTDFQIADFDI